MGASHKGPGKQRGHPEGTSLESSAKQQKPQAGHDHGPKTKSLAQSRGHQASKPSKDHSTTGKHSVIQESEVHLSSQQSSQQSKPRDTQNSDAHLPLGAKINDPQAGSSTSENENLDSETSDSEDTNSDGSSSNYSSSEDSDSEAEQGPLATTPMDLTLTGQSAVGVTQARGPKHIDSSTKS